MRVDRINYQKTFNLGNYTSERIGLEAELEAGDDGEVELKKLKKAVEDLHKATNPGLYVEINPEYAPFITPSTNGLEVKPPPEKDYKAIQRLEILIDDAKTIEELAIYEDDAWKNGLKNMWLAKKETLDLIDRVEYAKKYHVEQIELQKKSEKH